MPTPNSRIEQAMSDQDAPVPARFIDAAQRLLDEHPAEDSDDLDAATLAQAVWDYAVHRNAA